MGKVVLYARAFGLVIRRRLERRRQRRQAEKENQIIKWGNEEKKKEVAYFYYALGGVAIVAVACSGVILYRTVNRMQDLHAMNCSEETQTVQAPKEPISIKEVAAEDSIAVDESLEITEEDIPLTATFMEADAFAGVTWQEVSGVSVTASSTLQSENQKSYDAVNMLDGDPSSNWQEGETGGGEGTVLTFHFEEPVVLCGIEIWNGNGTSEKKYLANNRPERVILEMGNRKTDYILNDQFGSQLIELSDCIETQELVITIDSVYEGDKYEDTCISDIKFYSEEE